MQAFNVGRGCEHDTGGRSIPETTRGRRGRIRQGDAEARTAGGERVRNERGQGRVLRQRVAVVDAHARSDGGEQDQVRRAPERDERRADEPREGGRQEPKNGQ